jgi:CheY-like chemotaxis protein
MKERHLALVVEDDPETAEDLGQILESVGCGSVVVDNAEDAEKRLQEKSFCLILLDLQIKGAPDEIKGHVEYGKLWWTPFFGQKSDPFLDGVAALKMRRRQCRKRERIIRRA